MQNHTKLKKDNKTNTMNGKQKISKGFFSLLKVTVKVKLVFHQLASKTDGNRL